MTGGMEALQIPVNVLGRRFTALAPDLSEAIINPVFWPKPSREGECRGG
jgi:hypothetical protein